MSTARRAAWIFGTLIVLGTLGLVAWRNLTRSAPENDSPEYYMRLAVPVFASLPRSPTPAGLPSIAATALADAMQAGLSSAEIVGAAPRDEGWDIELPEGFPPELAPRPGRITRPMHASLVAQAADLLALRFDPDGVDAYLAERARRGALPDAARYEHHYPGSFVHSARLVRGDAYSGDETPETLLRLTFRDNLPTHVAGGDGLAIAYGVASSDYRDADLSPAALGYEGWSGGLSLTYGPMTVPARTLDDIVAAHGPVPLALVGTVVYYEDRPPRPLCLRFVWDPRASDWMLDRVVITNITEEEASSRAPPNF